MTAATRTNRTPPSGSQRGAVEHRQAARSIDVPAVTVALTMDAAAERLGVTPRMVRRLVSERRIGFVRVGKFIRLRQQDLDSYLEQHFQPPLDRQRGGSGV
ncbi:MAG: helix-turn-helix domain-containing protein [Acidimicrobiales bacterium]